MKSDVANESDDLEVLEILDGRGRTDSANAKRLHRRHGHNFRWCEKWLAWLTWDNRRWAIDASRRMDAMAKGIADDVWNEIAAVQRETDRSTATELARFGHNTASGRGVAATLALARSEPGVAVLPEVFDADPWLFNCANGTLDLRTGELRPFSRADYLTTLCPTAYDPKAACPTWEAMLETILGGHAELISFLQRALGYALTGSVSEQIMFLMHGKGANGKSTFLNAAMDTIGTDYAIQAADGLLTVKQGEVHSTERADLFGKRLVSSIELGEGKRLNEPLVKQLTGGDKIRARRMRENHWEFTPTHKLFVATNHKPVIRGTDNGIWRRVRLIPFEVTIPESKQDKQLAEKLAAERAGILAWMVRGCIEWQQIGLEAPTAVVNATNAYREDMDVVGAFLAECCVMGDGYSEKAGSIYRAYTDWCKASGEHAVTQRTFGQALTEREFERYSSNGKRYRGLRLTDPTDPTDPFPG